MTDKNIAFVATQFLPPKPPPAATTGIMGWLRENLFSGVFNSILTILSILLILWLVPSALEWALVNAVWDANNIRECRAVLAIPELKELIVANKLTADFNAISILPLLEQEAQLRAIAGDAAKDLDIPGGACWAVIVERFDQFIYGFYPEEYRWRPNIAFLLLLVAIAYALFDKLPFRSWGLIYAALYPVIAYFLIWGGSIDWFVALVPGVISAGALLLIGRNTFKELGFNPSGTIHAANFAAGGFFMLYLAIIVFMSLFDDKTVDYSYGFEDVESRQLGGFLLATIIGIAGIVLSLPIGILLALGRRSHMVFIKTICVVFIEFIRGVPLITLLFVANSVLAYFFPPEASLDLILRVVIMVTLFASAYMAEVVRGGLAALPQGQYEAADSLGLNYWQSMRLIIMPQALKISIPNIVSSFIGLFKDTTLVVVIGLLDPIGLIGTIRAHPDWNGLVWEFYVFVALFFFIVCFGMSRYSMYLERKLATDHR